MRGTIWCSGCKPCPIQFHACWYLAAFALFTIVTPKDGASTHDFTAHFKSAEPKYAKPAPQLFSASKTSHFRDAARSATYGGKTPWELVQERWGGQESNPTTAQAPTKSWGNDWTAQYGESHRELMKMPAEQTDSSSATYGSRHWWRAKADTWNGLSKFEQHKLGHDFWRPPTEL